MNNTSSLIKQRQVLNVNDPRNCVPIFSLPGIEQLRKQPLEGGEEVVRPRIVFVVWCEIPLKYFKFNHVRL